MIIACHETLLCIINSEKPISQFLSPIMLRWSFLGACDCKLVFVPGIFKTNADGSNRFPAPIDVDEPVPHGEVPLFDALKYPPLQEIDIANFTKEDYTLTSVKEWILSGWLQEYLGGVCALLG